MNAKAFRAILAGMPDDAEVLMRDSEHGIIPCAPRLATVRQSASDPDRFYGEREIGFFLHKTGTIKRVVVVE